MPPLVPPIGRYHAGLTYTQWEGLFAGVNAVLPPSQQVRRAWRAAC